MWIFVIQRFWFNYIWIIQWSLHATTLSENERVLITGRAVDLLPHPVASYGTWCLTVRVGPLCYTPKVNIKTGCAAHISHVTRRQPCNRRDTWETPSLEPDIILPVSSPNVVMAAGDWSSSVHIETIWVRLVWSCLSFQKETKTLHLFVLIVNGYNTVVMGFSRESEHNFGKTRVSNISVVYIVLIHWLLNKYSSVLLIANCSNVTWSQHVTPTLLHHQTF